MAAVDKIEEERKPEDFIGNRNRRWQKSMIFDGGREIRQKKPEEICNNSAILLAIPKILC